MRATPLLLVATFGCLQACAPSETSTAEQEPTAADTVAAALAAYDASAFDSISWDAPGAAVERGGVVFRIADRGPGVPKADHRAVFQAFWRGREQAADVPGSGLGLALVQQAAQLHGGRVELADRDGGGAVFSLWLPSAGEGA